MRGLSIRARITLQTLLVALLLCTGAVVAFRVGVQEIVNSALAELLAADAAPIEAQIHRGGADPAISIGEDQLIAVVSPSGRIVASTLPAGLASRMPELLALSTTPQALSTPTRSYLARLEHDHSDSGTWLVITARNVEEGEVVMGKLTIALVIGDLVLVAGFAGAAWLLTGAALRPVSALRREAELLSRRGSLAALPVGETGDELDQLATTLNTFIERNRQTVEREKQMVSDASHELRTPLAVLRGQLELASAPDRGIAELRDEIAAARRTTARLATLTTNLLELAKLEATHDDSSAPWEELQLQLAAGVDRARLLAGPRGVAVDFDVTVADDNARYRVAPAAFASAVDNLVTNAIAAAHDRGSVQVTVGQSAGELVVRVIDDGPGMPESFIPVAFNRFSRPDDSRPSDTGGSGLGLAIVHAIVTGAGGSIGIENRAPGLEVWFRLPRADADPGVRSET
ncbi:sensor histidine kinase [Galbitalea soli]|nr:HAMP domain-containing sensor histidine kinase [Galbitalea soli]